ncbi:MFS transporter [soil metagenome]
MQAEADILDSRYSWARLMISLAIATVASVGMWSVVLVLPHVQTEFGISRADAALPYAATMAGYALGNLLIGRAVDRFGVTPALIAAGFALCAGFLLAAVSTDVLGFGLAQGLLIGTGAAAGFGPLMADISHWFRRRRGVAVAIAASGNYLAGALWPLALKGWLEVGDWRGAYAVVAVVCVVLILPLALLLRRRLPVLPGFAPGSSAAPVRRIDLGPRALVVLLSLAGVACCVAMSMPQVHIVAYCIDLGYGAAAGAEMLALMLGAGIVSRLASGWLADRIGGVLTLLIGASLQGLALTLYIPFDGLASLYVVSMIFGLAQGGIVPAYAIIIREYLPARQAGATVGLVIMATIVGMALGGWLSGWIFDATGSYGAAFLNGIGWNALNVGILLLILLRTRGVRQLAPA